MVHPYATNWINPGHAQNMVIQYLRNKYPKDDIILYTVKRGLLIEGIKATIAEQTKAINKWIKIFIQRGAIKPINKMEESMYLEWQQQKESLRPDYSN